MTKKYTEVIKNLHVFETAKTKLIILSLNGEPAEAEV